jgi:putative transposase
VPRPLRIDFAGAVHHVIARGNEKKPIFRDDNDRLCYLDRLAACRRRFDFQLYAFCLMENHVHLAIERGPVALSRIVLTLHSGYAQSFNRRHGRVGHLFQGRYKAFLVEKDPYLLTLIRYIHMNPVKAGIAARPASYRWSSDRFYRGKEPPSWLDTNLVTAMLGTMPAGSAAQYARLMAVDQDEYDSIRPRNATIIGTDVFAKEAFRSAGARPEPRSWSIQSIAAHAARSGGRTLEQLRRRGRSTGAAHLRGVTAYLAREYAGIPVCRTASFFDRDESTLIRDVLRIEASMPFDPRVKACVREVVASLEKAGAHG